MKTIKVIDLLNKIANEEEVPKKIRYQNYIYEYQHRRDTENSFNYMCNENGEYLSRRYFIDNILNDEIEIIEEENKKCTVETCCIGIERLSKALLKIKDDMKSIYENIDKVETLEEEKKIPEKLPIYGCTDAYSKFDINDNRKAINEIIDYLKSKGE